MNIISIITFWIYYETYAYYNTIISIIIHYNISIHYNSVIMGLRDTLFAIITFVIMAYNGVIMETRFADVLGASHSDDAPLVHHGMMHKWCQWPFSESVQVQSQYPATDSEVTSPSGTRCQSWCASGHLEPRFYVYTWNIPCISHVYAVLIDIPRISMYIHGYTRYIQRGGYTWYTWISMYIHHVYTTYIHGYTWYINWCISMVYTWYIHGYS